MLFLFVLVSLFTRIAWTQLAVLENSEQGAVISVHNKSCSCLGSGKIFSGKFLIVKFHDIYVIAVAKDSSNMCKLIASKINLF